MNHSQRRFPFAASVDVIEGRTLFGIARDLANGLADLHAAGIAHGDIKPQNVMLFEQNGVKRAILLDMGLAVAADSVVPRGATRRYLAPEALATDVDSDGRTRDLWALGLLLAELADKRVVDQAPEHVAQNARLSGKMGDIVGPLLLGSACRPR